MDLHQEIQRHSPVDADAALMTFEVFLEGLVRALTGFGPPRRRPGRR
jgi:hypothetical protein